MIRRLLLALAFSAATAGAAQDLHHHGAPPPGTDPGEIVDRGRPQQPRGQSLPLKPTRRISFQTDEATWASLDLSPDGRTIVFDLLGDLYRVDRRGGPARRISGGMAIDAQPTYSPDGRSIAYVSDRSGAENLWIARSDGTGARQATFGDDDSILVSPAWSADGRALFVSRYRADLNGYELWRHELGGRETLLVPIREEPDMPRSAWRSSLGAVASPDGSYLYFARHVGPLDFEAVDEWTIVRRDLHTGDELTIVGEPEAPRKAMNPGAAFRPLLSPDGRFLAYGKRTDGQTELRLRDLSTGSDRRLAFPIQRDQLQASMWQDILPRYDFTPDGQAILLSRNGKFERLPISGGKASPMPFSANVTLDLGPLARAEVKEESGPVRARIIQAPETSPDGRQLAFSAFGQLYVANLGSAGARPRHLPTPTPAFQPSWSEDGRSLAFVTWTAREGGHVWVAPADGSAPARRVSDAPAFYTQPVFRPGGTELLALRSPRAARLRTYMEYGILRDAELLALPLSGGSPRTLLAGKLGGKPHFTTSPGKVFLLFDDGLNEVDLASGARSLIASVKGPGWYFQDGPVAVDDLRLSPDGKWLLAQVSQQLHLVARPPPGKTDVDLSKPDAPHRRITTAGADYFEWGRNGHMIGWTAGSTFYRRAFADIALNPAHAPGWSVDRSAKPAATFPIVVEMPRDQPRGAILLRGASAVTMSSRGVIDASDILVVDGRIAAIGAKGSLSVPPDATVREVAGKWIVPGYIDTHDHIANVRRDVLELDDWGLRARLAYGITTAFDPSTLTVDMLAYEDLLDAGLMIGPRLPSTGVALFSMQRFSSVQEVREVLRRYRDRYRLGNIKEYRTGNRRVRQWIAEAASELGMQTTAEGALGMKLDLSQIIDGYAGQEHALVAAPLGRDWIELIVRSGTGYTTTLQITNGGPPAQDRYIALQNPHDDPKYRRFTPHFAADQMTRHREWRPPGEYRYPAIAVDAARVQRAGGLVGMGAHGEMPGIGYHWELEAHAEGGMTPAEILSAATIGAARVIGRESDVGSLEPGKFADLVILDADPRVTIRNARAIGAVMKNGRLYDGSTLDQLWPDQAPLPPAWFSDEERTNR